MYIHTHTTSKACVFTTQLVLSMTNMIIICVTIRLYLIKMYILSDKERMTTIFDLKSALCFRNAAHDNLQRLAGHTNNNKNNNNDNSNNT